MALTELVNDALASNILDTNALGINAKAILYEVGIRNSYRATAQTIGSLDNLPLTIGRPSKYEADTVRRMHQQIWKSTEDALYPTDIHSREFGLATDLVVRSGDEVAGFLMGYYKEGGFPLPADWWTKFNGGWRVESQVMGVLPTYRGQQLGYLLKRAQGELTQNDGISIVNWTVDPLQFSNAVLNFGKLGAVAFDFHRDLYPFRNELNRVPASRFGVTWLVGTNRVRSRPLDFRIDMFRDIVAEEIPVLNHKYEQVLTQPEVAQIAIEIPAKWTAIQQNDLALAIKWRNALDTIFESYIGIDEGKYTITDVGKANAGQEDERCYLIAERSDSALWAKLEG